MFPPVDDGPCNPRSPGPVPGRCDPGGTCREPAKMAPMTTTPFELAVEQVRAGADPADEAAGLVAQMTPDEQRWCLDGDLPFWAGLGDMGRGGYHRRTFPAARVERLGIPGFAFSDGPRGVVIGPATCFPVSMARGATWDLDLEERIGDAIGTELRAVGADLYGGVCINVLRHPAWGRAQETYGEDPFHVGEMGAALTRGVQRHTMACVKHFAANSMENARFTVDVTIDEAALHEVFLPHFRRVVDEGVAAVMSAYNSVNGEWCGQNRELLTDVLRDEWGFEGIVISDWIAGVRDAGRSVHAGLDVEMPYRMVRARDLEHDLEAGGTDAEEVAATATRVVATQLRWADRLDRPAVGLDVLARPEHRALAREAATRSVVLLRNEDVDGRPALPIDAGAIGRVTVVGRLAAVPNLGDGGSSDVWAPSAVTPLEGLRAALEPGVEVVHHEGADPAAAAEVAADADVTVVVVGYTKADEGEYIGPSATDHLRHLMPGPDDPALAAAFEARVEADPHNAFRPVLAQPTAGTEGDDDRTGFAAGGDRESLRLHPNDEELIRAVAAANPRTVVAVVAGSAVVVEPWRDAPAAVVQSWYAGMEGGHALADVLLGRAEPSGRLPFTVPTDPEHLPPFDRDATTCTYDRWHGYWLLQRDGHAPAFPFGFGLSYTDLAIESASAEVADGRIVVEAVVADRGARPGVEVVQIYLGAAGEPRKLVGFARVEVAAGERRPVTVEVPVGRAARRDVEAHAWRPASGPHQVVVARHAADPDGHQLTVEL